MVVTGGLQREYWAGIQVGVNRPNVICGNMQRQSCDCLKRQEDWEEVGTEMSRVCAGLLRTNQKEATAQHARGEDTMSAGQ